MEDFDELEARAPAGMWLELVAGRLEFKPQLVGDHSSIMNRLSHELVAQRGDLRFHPNRRLQSGKQGQDRVRADGVLTSRDFSSVTCGANTEPTPPAPEPGALRLQ
ncbi:hypothetical protein N566_05330 [Streptomycetaceae bacterium MP113-05]|nr:hypothetical protein N566_05330 [Streptomycetaceae bacterium MP113-05]